MPRGRRGRSNTTRISFFAFQDIITAVVGIFLLITIIMALELAQKVSQASAVASPRVEPSLLASIEQLETEVEDLGRQRESFLVTANQSSTTNKFNRDEQIRELSVEMERIEQEILRSTKAERVSTELLNQAKKRASELVELVSDAEYEKSKIDSIESEREEVRSFSTVLESDSSLIFRDTTKENRWLVLVQLTAREIRLSDAKTGAEEIFGGAGRVASFGNWLSRVSRGDRQILLIAKPSGIEDFDSVVRELDSANATYGYDVGAEEGTYILRSAAGGSR